MNPDLLISRSLAVVLAFFCVGTGFAAEIRLEYRAENLPDTIRPTPELHLQVSQGATTITDGERSLLIDYEGRRVVSRFSPKEPPREYPLFPPIEEGERPQGMHGGLDEEIAKYEITHDGPGASVNGWRTDEKTIHFGASLASSSVAGPFAVKRYGRSFRERRIHIRVTNEHPEVTALREIADQHRPLVRANPFLLQLDWVNMIPILQGLPVALVERSRNVVLLMVLKGEPGGFYLREEQPQ